MVALVIAGCGGTDNTSPSISGQGQELLRAAETALGKVPDSRIAEIKRGDDATWQVSALEPAGTAQKLIVSADGTTVIEGPTAQRDEGSEEDFRLLESAGVDYRRALEILLVRLPSDTSLESAELRFEGVDAVQVKDAKRGKPPETWSTSVSNPHPVWFTADGTEGVIIDATTGETLS